MDARRGRRELRDRARRLRQAEHKAPAFLATNPAGELPALVDGETRLFENAAIALYLGDKLGKHAPKIDAPDRGRYLSWVVYSKSQLEPAMGDVLLKAETHPSRGWTTFDERKQAVERELGDRDYLLGTFTLADVLIGSMFVWKRRFGGPGEGSIIDAYVDRLLARPAAASLRG